MLWVWIATFLILRQAAADTITVDKCPTPTVVESNFTLNKYAGTWYEIESIPNALEYGGRCVRFTYKSSNGIALNVELNMDKPKTGETISYYGQLVPAVQNSNEAKFHISYLTPAEAAKVEFPPEKYWILGTDYESYSVAWSCVTYQTSAESIPRHKAWILGRQKTMSKETYAEVEKVLNKADIFPRYSLKETIPCSGGVICSMNLRTLLTTLVIGRMISWR